MVNWISLSTTTGNSGETQITLTVSPNTEYSSRTTTLNVTTQSKHLTDNIVINQAQKSATGSMTFNPSGLSYSYEGGILYLHFTANTDWNVVSWPTWVGVSGDVSGGTGSYVWGVTALQNTRLEDLNSQFTFYCGGNYFTIPVHQDAYGTGAISVSPASISNISSGGSAYTLTVSANTNWTVTSKPEWATLSQTAGTGNATITVTIPANSGDTRTGSIGFSTNDNVASASVSLSQNANSSYNPYVSEYLTFEIQSDGDIKWVSSFDITKTIEYSKNDGTWTSITSSRGGTQISVVGGDIVKFRGDNVAYGLGNGDRQSFNATCNIKVYGNVMSLISPTDFSGLTVLQSAYTFEYLFSDCTGLTDASNLVLPATTLTNYCYRNMFYGCTNLIAAPALPATNLSGGNGCYYIMFWGCTSLTTAPELPATTLSENCYESMFQNCTSLTQAPSILPATTLVNRCYYAMFKNCDSLTTAPELPAPTLTPFCYYDMFNLCENLNYIKCLATNISATVCTQYWVRSVSSSGTFVKNPAMSSWTTGVNGIPNGWTVQDA